MGLSEKQAVVMGVGGLAVLYLLKHHKGLSPKAATLKASAGSPAGTVSSASRPSANLATRNATATRAQQPSTVGRILQSPQARAAETGFARWLASIFKPRSAGIARAPQPSAQPQPRSSSSPTSGGGSGGGSQQASRSGYQSPGGNPWSSSGDFTGRSSVTSDYRASDYYTIDPNTGLPYEDAGPQLPAGTVDADGTASDDPSALEFVGPTQDADPSTEFVGPIDDTPGGADWQGPIDDPSAGDPSAGSADWQGPVDQAPADFGNDSSTFYDYGSGGSSGGGDEVVYDEY